MSVTGALKYKTALLSPKMVTLEECTSQAIWLVLFFAVAIVGVLIAPDVFASPGSANTMIGSGEDEICIMTASGGSGLADPICNILSVLDLLLKGTTGEAITALAICVMGVMALFGKLTMIQALLITSGIALLFGADSLIIALGAGGGPGGQVGGSDPISQTLMNLTNQITGTTGRAVGSFAVIIVGVGALMGKVSWVQAVVLILGLGLIFGAADIVTTVTYATDSGEVCDAGADDPVCQSFFNFIHVMTGQAGTSIATLGIMVLGFMALMGKLTWIRAILLASGIAVIFAAGNVVSLLSGPLNPCALSSLSTVSDPFTRVICGFMAELQGPTGKTIATLAVIVIGILSMLGKISWELAFVVTIGVALVFGANAIVEILETTLAGVNCNSAAPSAPSTGNAIADVLCYIILILYGPAGKAIATVAVIMMGFGALMGKVSYSQAFIVAVGIAVTFGAPAIVKIILPSASTGGCTLPAAGTATGC